MTRPTSRRHGYPGMLGWRVCICRRCFQQLMRETRVGRMPRGALCRPDTRRRRPVRV